MGHRRLRDWLIVLALPACRRRRDYVAELLPNDQRLELQFFAVVLCMTHQNGTANNLFE